MCPAERHRLAPRLLLFISSIYLVPYEFSLLVYYPITYDDIQAKQEIKVILILVGLVGSLQVDSTKERRPDVPVSETENASPLCMR